MNFHDDHETQAGARGGVWHLHHKPGKAIPQKDMAFKDEPLALVAETIPDQDRIQAEARERAETERARKQFHEEHQLTLV